MNVLFACGGTGGHINPAIAVAQQLRQRTPETGILFVGADDNMEMELVPRDGFEIRGLTIGNLHRSLKPKEIRHNLRSARLLFRAVRESKRIVREFRPDVVLGTGGYVCYPVLRAASALHVPTLLHEANARPGLTTRMLEPFTDRILTAFEESASGYRHPDRVLTVGMPVRDGFRTAVSDLPQERPTVLCFGGSLGAKRLNAAIAAVAAENEQTGAFRIIHAAGSEEAVSEMRETMKKLGAETLRFTELYPYLYDMPRRMAEADLIVCRAGASTLGELAAAGKPAVLVPYPYATGDHQTKNAQVPVGRGAARILADSDCTAERLGGLIRELCRDPETLRSMGAAMRSLDRADALETMITETLRLAGTRQPR